MNCRREVNPPFMIFSPSFVPRNESILSSPRPRHRLNKRSERSLNKIFR